MELSFMHSSEQEGMKMNKESIYKIGSRYGVTIVFLVLSILGFFISGLTPSMVISDLIERFGRNLFLVFSLVIPIMAGMGINFSIVIGAMAGQLALITVLIFSWKGTLGLLAAMVISVPLSILFGWGIAAVLNRSKGNEMITSFILGFFASGAYQFLCLILPVNNPQIALEGGIGMKSTLDLKTVQYGFDRFPIDFKLFGYRIPLFTLFLSFLLCLFLVYLKKTKLGQDMRAAGEDEAIAETVGIEVNQTRRKAVLFSTLFAAWGQIISLQNIGTMSTFGSHEQVSIYAAAALLTGGATTKKAEVRHAILGVFLFYFLFIVAPRAGKQLWGDAQTGEFFRVFLAYGVIAFALVWNERKEKKREKRS